MANTRETMGEQACLDALVADTLTSFEDDGVTRVGGYGLANHNALVNVVLPQCKGVHTYGILGCSNLEVVDMLGTGSIQSGAFQNDSKLAHLLLRGDSKTNLIDVSAFTGTAIASGNGAIYVDDDLLDTYNADGKWRNFYITTLDKYPASSFETIDDDWATIVAKAEAGTASQSYSVGDTKLLDLGTEGKVYAQIAAFNADPLANDGTNTAGITFITKGTIASSQKMNFSSTSAGGWASSSLRQYLSNTILPLIPSTVRSAIKEVTKYSDYYADSAIVHDQATIDKLWVPSVREVANGTSFEQTGPRYDSLFSGSTIKCTQSGNLASWWLRTSYNSSNFYLISAATGYRQTTASQSRNVAIGFCI